MLEELLKLFEEDPLQNPLLDDEPPPPNLLEDVDEELSLFPNPFDEESLEAQLEVVLLDENLLEESPLGANLFEEEELSLENLLVDEDPEDALAKALGLLNLLVLVEERRLLLWPKRFFLSESLDWEKPPLLLENLFSEDDSDGLERAFENMFVLFFSDSCDTSLIEDSWLYGFSFESFFGTPKDDLSSSFLGTAFANMFSPVGVC